MKALAHGPCQIREVQLNMFLAKVRDFELTKAMLSACEAPKASPERTLL